MKVEFYGEEFKKVVDRALVVVPKKTYVDILHCVRLEAKKDCITITSTDLEGYANIKVDAKVYEPGIVYIDSEDIKKIYNLKGNVILESISETNTIKLLIHNSKKKSAVLARLYTDKDLSFPENPDHQIIETTEKDLLSALSDLAPYISNNESNKTMTGYYFDSNKNRIIALDGCRVGIKNMSKFFIDECSAIVPVGAYLHLKKIANNKSDKKIKVYKNYKYIKFEGDDFTYTSRLIDGEYFKIDAILNANYDCEFSLAPKEIGELAKEYKKTLKGNERLPMFLTYNFKNKVMYTGISTASYITFDLVDSLKINSGLNKELTYAFNPTNIIDAMNLFNENVMCKCLHCEGIQKTPIVFYNDTYTVLVLPVNADRKNVERFKEFVA